MRNQSIENRMSFTKHCNEIFNRAIRDYHVNDDIDTPIQNPFEEGSIENRLYLKCWIDTVQWHFDMLQNARLNCKFCLNNSKI